MNEIFCRIVGKRTLRHLLIVKNMKHAVYNIINMPGVTLIEATRVSVFPGVAAVHELNEPKTEHA